MEEIRTLTDKVIKIKEFEIPHTVYEAKTTFSHGMAGVLGVPKFKYPFKYVFGMEIENMMGFQISPKIMSMGLSVNKKTDGSVTGMEYTTGLLSGDEGMNELERIVSLMKSHKYDMNCGTHIHLSNLVMTPYLDLPFLITLLYKSLGELRSFLMSEDRAQNAQYCRPYSQWDIASSSDFILTPSFYISGSSVCFGRKDFRLKGFINNPRKEGILSSTVEIRMLGGTNEFDKLKGFVLLSSAILDYFEKNRFKYRHLLDKGSTNQVLKIIPDVFTIIESCDKLTDSMKTLIFNMEYNEDRN